MTERKRRQNFAKCCRVFFPKLNGSMSDGSSVAEKNLLVIGSEMCHVFLFFLKHRCDHSSKRIEAVRFLRYYRGR